MKTFKEFFLEAINNQSQRKDMKFVYGSIFEHESKLTGKETWEFYR